MTTAGLPRSRPADHDVDPGAVLGFLDAVEADPGTELHGLMVLRHGHVVAEGWWYPHTAERTRLLYSLSKSFTSTALGFALEERRLGLDDPVVSFFPEFEADIVDPRSRSLTVRHLASMASGHDREMIHEAVERDPQEPVRGFLLVPPDAAPGELFAYSQPCTYTIAAIVQRVAGMSLTEYLRSRLFDPLGIRDVRWWSWPPGRELGYSGLFARTEDVAKLGQLYLQGGRWGDDQLLPESYVTLATSRHVGTPNQENVDWRQGYGFQFWMSRHGYRGDGAFGQFCVVLPEQDAVVAVTAGTEAMQAVLDHMWEHLLPGLGGATPDLARQPDLDERLAGLRLPPCEAHPPPRGWDGSTAARFGVAQADQEASASTLTSVELKRSDAGLSLTLTEPANSLTFAVGATDWLVSAPRDRRGDAVPVAASGGWLDDDTVRVEVVFLETPHRLDVTCSPTRRAATAVWRGKPLDGGRIETLHRPGPPVGYPGPPVG